MTPRPRASTSRRASMAVRCATSTRRAARRCRSPWFAAAIPGPSSWRPRGGPTGWAVAETWARGREGGEVAEGGGEYGIGGGGRGKPVEVINGPVTGLPIPANAEIVLEGFVEPGNERIEGPFAEWTGYYASDLRPEPVLDIKAVYYRNNPILLG